MVAFLEDSCCMCEGLLSPLVFVVVMKRYSNFIDCSVTQKYRGEESEKMSRSSILKAFFLLENVRPLCHKTRIRKLCWKFLFSLAFHWISFLWALEVHSKMSYVVVLVDKHCRGRLWICGQKVISSAFSPIKVRIETITKELEQKLGEEKLINHAF